MFRSLSLASLLAAIAIAPAFAAPGEFGQAAPAAQARRTITITMKDNEYEPKSVTVKAGEVVRFIVLNKGELLHEFAVGRPQGLRRCLAIAKFEPVRGEAANKRVKHFVAAWLANLLPAFVQLDVDRLNERLH